MVTIREVAERAGVSLGTVSRVLNNHPSVRPAVRAKVNVAIQALGYVPNPAAQSLRSARTRTIGLIVPDLLSSMTVELVRGVEDAVRPLGYALLVAESRFDPAHEAIHITNLLDRRVDGLLISPLESVSAVERAVTPSGIPTVLIQLRQPRRELPSAFVDEGPAIRSAVAELVAAGHRRVAFVHSAARVAGGRHRRELFRGTMAEHGITEGDELDGVFSDAEGCRRLVIELLRRPNRPTALVVGVHQFVPAALRAIREAGLEVGRDLSVIAFGDSEWARSMSPALSAIFVDQREHAEGAVDLLMRVMSGDRSGPMSIRSESVFIRRESCQPPRVEVAA